MSVERVLSGLSKVRRNGHGSWSACCPAHEDRSPSLAVKETDDGRVLLHCFGGCSVDAVVGALGLDLSDLFPPRQKEPGAGMSRVRRPWVASDLVRLASFESLIVHTVGVDMLAGNTVSDADLGRFVEAVARLGDVANAASV